MKFLLFAINKVKMVIERVIGEHRMTERTIDSVLIFLKKD